MSNTFGPLTRFRFNNVIATPGATGAQGATGATGPQGLGFLSIPSVSVLRGTPGVAQQTVALQGYTTANDGGEGVFVWKAGDATADDGGTIIAATGGTWRRIWTGPFNVCHFGADRSGVADSTAAFVACLAACTGRMEVPDGLYNISGLTINKAIKLLLGQVTITGTGANAVFSVNHNTRIYGQSAYESVIVAPSGQSAIAFAGSWPSFGDLGTQIFYAEDIGLSNGVHGIDTSGIVGNFSQGRWDLNRVRIYNTTDRAINLTSAISFTSWSHVDFTNCNGSAKSADNTETKTYFCLHYPAPGATNANYELDSGHRFHIHEDVFESAANRSAPDILLYCRNGFNQAGGFIHIRECEFAPEREFSWNTARNRILCYYASNPTNAAGPVVIKDNYFFSGSSQAVAISSITVAAGVATATLTLGGGQTDCGVQIGDKVSVVQNGLLSDVSLNGGPFTVTGKPAGNKIQWNTSVGNKTVAGGFLEPESLAAIAIKSPATQWNIDGNWFSGYPYCIDDLVGAGNNTDSNFRNSINKNVWGPNNRVIGQAGRSAQVFKSGAGIGFDKADVPLSTPDAPLLSVPTTREIISLQNRCWQSEQAQVLNCTQTTAQTDPFGGTGAFIITRNGTLGGLISSGALNEAASIEVDVGASVALPTNPPLSWITFWAKQGGTNPSNIATVFFLTGSPSVMWWQQTITLGTNWKKYRFPIVWIPAFSGNTNANLYFAPGGLDPEATSAVFSRFMINDNDTDYLPNYTATGPAAAMQLRDGVRTKIRVTHAMSPFTAPPNSVCVVDSSGGAVTIQAPVLQDSQFFGVVQAAETAITGTITVTAGSGQLLGRPGANITSFVGSITSTSGDIVAGGGLTWANLGAAGGKLNLIG